MGTMDTANKLLHKYLFVIKVQAIKDFFKEVILINAHFVCNNNNALQNLVSDEVTIEPFLLHQECFVFKQVWQNKLVANQRLL